MAPTGRCGNSSNGAAQFYALSNAPQVGLPSLGVYPHHPATVGSLGKYLQVAEASFSCPLELDWWHLCRRRAELVTVKRGISLRSDMSFDVTRPSFT